MVFTENMHDAYSDSANLDKCLKTVDSKDLDNSAVDKKNSFCNKNDADNEEHEDCDNKRRVSEAVRLEFIADDIQRRHTKANMDNKILKLLSVTMHRPSMFVPAKLGCIQECVNESQEKIPSYETAMKCTTDKNIPNTDNKSYTDHDSHTLKTRELNSKKDATPHSSKIENSPTFPKKDSKEGKDKSDSSTS